MSKRVFIGNLDPDLSDQELGSAFGTYGAVLRAEVVRGRGGRGRGFGYVELGSEEEATRAIAELDGRELRGREMTVAEARRRRSPEEEADLAAEISRRHTFRNSNRRDR